MIILIDQKSSFLLPFYLPFFLTDLIAHACSPYSPMLLLSAMAVSIARDDPEPIILVINGILQFSDCELRHEWEQSAQHPIQAIEVASETDPPAIEVIPKRFLFHGHFSECFRSQG
jgi:hypothetical protein